MNVNPHRWKRYEPLSAALSGYTLICARCALIIRDISEDDGECPGEHA